MTVADASTASGLVQFVDVALRQVLELVSGLALALTKSDLPEGEREAVATAGRRVRELAWTVAGCLPKRWPHRTA